MTSVEVGKMSPKEPANTETVTPPGRTLVIRNESRDIEELRLDPNNPRIRHEQAARAADGKPLSEVDIEEFLWKKEEVKKLFQAIRANRGLIERIYITSNGLVVEGNERTVALRKIAEHLKKTEETHFREDEAKALRALVKAVPCKVLPQDITQAELDVLLAQWHVAGKAEWPALDQAAHVYKLINDDGFTVPQVAELLRVSPAWVYQRLKAFEWTEAYLNKYGREKISDYSYFEELYKKKKAVKEAGLDVECAEGMEIFQRIVNNKSLPMAIDVRKLPKLLENDATRDLMIKGDGKRAMKILPDVDPTEFSSRFVALNQARIQLHKLTREDLQKIKESPAARQLLEDIAEEIEKVLAQVNGVKVHA